MESMFLQKLFFVKEVAVVSLVADTVLMMKMVN